MCYWIAVQNGHLPWCIPYIDSCTSISAAGRQGVEYYVFKGLMIPGAVLIALYWIGVFYWLRTLRSGSSVAPLIILSLALVASAGLILYSVVLGAIGEGYRSQRRLGVILFFAMTFFAQLILLLQLRKTEPIKSRNSLPIRGLLSISSLVLLSGLFAVAYSAYNEERYDSIEYALEWIVTLLLSLQPLFVAKMWANTDYRLSYTVKRY